MLLNQVSADYAVVLVREALKHDRDLLVDSTMTLRELERVDFMSVEQFMDLLNRFTELYQVLSHNKDWGFELGQKLSIASHGPLGFGAVSAETIGAGLAFFANYLSTRASYMSGICEAGHQNTVLRIIFETPVNTHRGRMCETLSVIIQELINISGGATEQIHWKFPTQGQARVGTYECWLNGSIEFDVDIFQITVPAAIAETASTFHNPTAYRAAVTQCEALHRNAIAADLLGVVSDLLRKRFEQRLGETTAVTTIPTAKESARQIGCSSRKLYREFQAQGTSFKQVKDEIMKEYLVDLSSKPLNVEEISYKLGFSDAGNFNRACKRLLGLTPGALIREKRN